MPGELACERYCAGLRLELIIVRGGSGGIPFVSAWASLAAVPWPERHSTTERVRTQILVGGDNNIQLKPYHGPGPPDQSGRRTLRGSNVPGQNQLS